jgi:hypothetical protein
VGRIVFSGKEQVALVRPLEGVLHLAMLNFAAEIRRPTAVVAAAEPPLGDEVFENHLAGRGPETEQARGLVHVEAQSGHLAERAENHRHGLRAARLAGRRSTLLPSSIGKSIAQPHGDAPPEGSVVIS